MTGTIIMSTDSAHAYDIKLQGSLYIVSKHAKYARLFVYWLGFNDGKCILMAITTVFLPHMH